MRYRLITMEIEVPWAMHHEAVRAIVTRALDAEPACRPHQEQVVRFVESPNKTIGSHP